MVNMPTWNARPNCLEYKLFPLDIVNHHGNHKYIFYFKLRVKFLFLMMCFHFCEMVLVLCPLFTLGFSNDIVHPFVA
jgi:hypothetical protein